MNNTDQSNPFDNTYFGRLIWCCPNCGKEIEPENFDIHIADCKGEDQ